MQLGLSPFMFSHLAVFFFFFSIHPLQGALCFPVSSLVLMGALLSIIWLTAKVKLSILWSHDDMVGSVCFVYSSINISEALPWIWGLFMNLTSLSCLSTYYFKTYETSMLLSMEKRYLTTLAYFSFHCFSLTSLHDISLRRNIWNSGVLCGGVLVYHSHISFGMFSQQWRKREQLEIETPEK